ncbi:hypothetical protein, partial [Bradyrhizobium brasilense]
MEKLQELSPNVRIAIGLVLVGVAVVMALLIASNIALLFARRHDGELHVFTVLTMLGGDDARAAKAARIG